MARPGRTGLGNPAADEWESILRGRYKYVFREVKVQGFGPAPESSFPGQPYRGPPLVRRGSVAEADYLVGDSLEDLMVIEIKLTPASGLTRPQAFTYPYIIRDGGEVVALTGELPTGTVIRRGNLAIFYSWDLESVRTGQIALDELVAQRLGLLKPAPLPLPPSQPPSIPPSSRALVNTAATPENRAISSIASAGEAVEAITAEASSGAAGLARTAVSTGETAQAALRASRIVVRSLTTLSRSLVETALLTVRLVGLDVLLITIQTLVMLEEQRRQRDLRAAIDQAVRSRLTKRLQTLVRSQGTEVADVFLAGWGRPSELFLYFSPLLDITSQPATDRQKYRFRVEFSATGPLTGNSVSRNPVEPNLVELSPPGDSYYAQFRWSIPFPLYTPFDAYLAYLDVVSEVFSRSWWVAVQRKKVTPTANVQLARLATHISFVAALLRMDHYAGFTTRNPFSVAQAVEDRVGTIVRIRRLTEKSIVPTAEKLERARILDPDVIVVTGASSAVQQRLERLLTAADGSIALSLRRLAADLSSIPDTALGYQRRGTLAAESAPFAFDRYRTQYFKKITGGLKEQLPEALRVPDLEISELPVSRTATVQVDPTLEIQ